MSTLEQLEKGESILVEGNKEEEMARARRQTEKRESFCVWEEDGNPKGGCLMPMGFLALISGTKLGERVSSTFFASLERERKKERVSERRPWESCEGDKEHL